MVIGEFSFCICGITFHLLYVFCQRFGERKHTVGIFGTIVFKFHHAIVRVIIRAGDADHFKIRTTDGVILFDGKSVTMAQIAGDKLVERTTDKVLVDLIENLCGELSQILLDWRYLRSCSVGCNNPCRCCAWSCWEVPCGKHSSRLSCLNRTG